MIENKGFWTSYTVLNPGFPLMNGGFIPVTFTPWALGSDM